MPPATAETLLADLSPQLDMFIRFLKADLTSTILEGDLGRGELGEPLSSWPQERTLSAGYSDSKKFTSGPT
ncbi:hypothetical protein N7497_001091 [Penicillium chrysogenum]|nr:hypothetical protein N7497_001091 [Penicillium chrysogenum]